MVASFQRLVGISRATYSVVIHIPYNYNFYLVVLYEILANRHICHDDLSVRSLGTGNSSTC